MFQKVVVFVFMYIEWWLCLCFLLCLCLCLYSKLVYIPKGGWVADSDGALRCSDCNLFPAADECGDDDDNVDDNDDILKTSMVTRKMVMTAMTIF